MALIRLVSPNDLASWKMTEANRLAKQIIGESLADFLLSEANRMAVKPEAGYWKILKEGRVSKLGSVAREIGGVKRFFEVTAFSAAPQHLGLLMQDVSRNFALRQLLAEETNHSQQIGNAVKTFLWSGDPETLNTNWVSKEAQSVLGYWPEHWCKMPNFWLEHVHDDDRETIRLACKNATVDGARLDYRMKAANGQTVWLHAVLSISESKLRRQELAGVMVDVTARKIAEEAMHDLSGRLLRSQDDERRRVARELHDGLGQYLSVMSMNVATLARMAQTLTPQQERLLAETADLAETCLRDVRTMSYLMHPPMLDEVGLVSALQWYVTGFSERSNVKVEIDAGEDLKHLPKVVEIAFFRIAQEALTNIYRHSGSATATIRLRNNGDGVELEIEDSGSGLEAELLAGIQAGDGGSKGVGIRGMKERMRELGGTLHVLGNGKGLLIRARVPLTSRAFEEEHDKEPVRAASGD